MKNSKLTGWKDVYQFTITQNIKNKSYIISTIVITLFVAILCFCLNFLPAIIFDVASSDKATVADVETVYLNDNSGCSDIDYTNLLQMEEISDDTTIVETTSSDVVNDQTEETKDLLVEIQAVESGYEIIATVPENSKVSDDDAEIVAQAVMNYFRQTHLDELNITADQIAFHDLTVSTSVTMLGEEETSFVALFVEYFINVALVLIFMLLINSYGKMTASVVAMEKSSKVMELLLTSVRPVATIVGKVLAMTVLLIGQIVLWIVVGTVTYFGSNTVLGAIDSKYADGLSKLLTILKDGGIVFQMSPAVVIIAIAIIITGFTVYITIAGFIGATVGKIEELGQSIQTFSFLAVVGAYVPLFGFINMISTGITSNPLLNISRILPICSLYIVPSEMLLGTNTVSMGLIAIGINLATLVVLMLFVSKVYESVILYSGNRLKLKDIIKMSKSK